MGGIVSYCSPIVMVMCLVVYIVVIIVITLCVVIIGVTLGENRLYHTPTVSYSGSPMQWYITVYLELH
jgi:hypothetical protein